MAAILWSIGGTVVLCRGLGWIVGTGRYWLIFVGIIVGSLKSYFVFDRTARKSIDRILGFGDKTCVGAVYSFKTWALVVSMIAIGIFLRRSSLSLQLVGILYVAIGWGLLLSSRHAWISLYRKVKHNPGEKDDQGMSENV